MLELRHASDWSPIGRTTTDAQRVGTSNATVGANIDTGTAVASEATSRPTSTGT